MRDLDHYLALFDEADTVGPQLLAEAVYAAREGELPPKPLDDGLADELRPIVRQLPDRDAIPVDEARAAAAALLLEAAADAYAPGDLLRGARLLLGDSQTEFGERLGYAAGGGQAVVSDWERGERKPGGEARAKFQDLAEGL